MQRAEKVIEIDAPVELVFDLFSDFESFPGWMRNIREVRRTGRTYTRWTADAPPGSSVEWEAETTRFEPDHRITWRSVRGDLETEGEVIFEETARGTTLMRVLLGYEAPAGRLGALVARLFGTNPQRQLEEDLERFADVAEERSRRESRRSSAGRATGRAAGGPITAGAGPARERREYLRSQLERRRRDAYDQDTGETRRDERGGYDPRFRLRQDQRDYGRDSRAGFERDSGRDSDGDSGRDSEREARRDSRAEFEEALREARRGQQESMRRYREGRADDGRRVRSSGEEWARDERRRGGPGEDRYRDEGRHARRRLAPQGQQDPDERRFDDERRSGRERRFDDERRSGERRADERRADDEDDERRPAPEHRYALTPREREMERARRRQDDEYSRQAFRRGVDRLMDEPPSKRWRRWED